LTNSMKLLENEIGGVNKEIQKMMAETKKIKVKLFGKDDSCTHSHIVSHNGSEESEKTVEPLIPK